MHYTRPFIVTAVLAGPTQVFAHGVHGDTVTTLVHELTSVQHWPLVAAALLMSGGMLVLAVRLAAAVRRLIARRARRVVRIRSLD
ncbi:MAG: hypothetical protein KDJ39_11265 [Gammaproteobacteria bacterium]|nr:hypothetical protein [Gammaproteobacteria bacterium]